MRSKTAIILVILTILVFISLNFDFQIVRYVNLVRNNILDDFFFGIAFVSSEIIILFVLTSLFLWQERKRKWILPLWLSLGFSALVSFIIKILIQRERPYQLGLISVIPSLEKASHLVWDFSFPSFHAMMAFSAIPILSKEFPKFRYIWIIFACLIAFSRLYFGLHFLSDILAGAVIGYLIGAFMVHLEDRDNLWERAYKKIFRR